MNKTEKTDPFSQGPGGEYRRRLDLRRRALARQQQNHIRIGNMRFVAFAAAGVIAWLAFVSRALSPWWLALPVIMFAGLIVVHEHVLRRRRSFERAASFYERGLSRMENRWLGNGVPGDRFRDPSHPYAEDLDLFGRGSVFELLCTARTRAGEQTLANWLKHAADRDEVIARQEAVAELRPLLDLREDLAILGADLEGGVHPEELAKWSQAPPLLDSPWIPAAAALLSAATVTFLVLWLAKGMGRDTFLILALAEILFALRFRSRVRKVAEGVERPGRDLDLLSQVLARAEREEFRSPKLADLRKALETGTLPPSRRIAQLNRLIVLLDSKRNQLFAPVAALLLWGTQLSFAIEKWRKNWGGAVPRWLEAVGDMEALTCLAGYAFEHPADPFPEIRTGGPCFEGERLGHPLLPEHSCVSNDVRLCEALRVLVVSGSNMSGKSTFLRTVGTNAVLSLAGAPVRARRLVLTPVAIGASIRVVDSLHAGSSRFYAEITRLRQLVELTESPLPLLFLLDELLHGTNSHDRRIGAEAVIRDLVRRGAIGLLTTHDLALSHIADVLSPRAENVHFEDYIKDGKIAFDYLVRPGVVQRSNALELMRSVGLDV